MYCYDQALTFDPNYVYAWSGRGMAMAEQGNPEDALVALIAPCCSIRAKYVWQAMGDTLYSLHRYDEALIAIDRALSSTTAAITLGYQRKYLYAVYTKPDQALALHERPRNRSTNATSGSIKQMTCVICAATERH